METSRIPVAGHENDNVIIITRKHIVSMLGVMLMILIMTLIPVLIIFLILKTNPVFVGGYFLNFLVISGSIYYLIVSTFAFTQWVSFYYDIFVVTDKEILDIAQEGLFDRRVTEISLLRIQDVSARIKGFFPTFFGYGDVVAESAGENSRTYIIDNVPHPVEIANKILALHNEHIAREERAAEVVTAEGDLRSHPMGWQPRPDPNNETPPAEEKVFEPCPACPPAESIPQQPISQFAQPQQPQQSPEQSDLPPPPQNIKQGEIKSEDLNSGGEIKF